jgi:hypothetical protein
MNPALTLFTDLLLAPLAILSATGGKASDLALRGSGGIEHENMLEMAGPPACAACL